MLASSRVRNCGTKGQSSRLLAPHRPPAQPPAHAAAAGCSGLHARDGGALSRGAGSPDRGTERGDCHGCELVPHLAVWAAASPLTVRRKGAGTDLFKDGQFEEAIDAYSRAVQCEQDGG